MRKDKERKERKEKERRMKKQQKRLDESSPSKRTKKQPNMKKMIPAPTSPRTETARNADPVYGFDYSDINIPHESRLATSES